jgi:preprotein translocase subunit SecY
MDYCVLQHEMEGLNPVTINNNSYTSPCLKRAFAWSMQRLYVVFYSMYIMPMYFIDYANVDKLFNQTNFPENIFIAGTNRQLHVQ